MAEKVAEYTGTFHVAIDSLKEKWASLKEGTSGESSTGPIQTIKTKASEKAVGCCDVVIDHLNKGNSCDYSHIYRRKSRMELIRISAAVMGIEFCYAAETAFVSPTLLKIGVHHAQMTLIWCLSPFVGFFLCPILGSLSDNCKSRLGRRRPFIIMLSIGILLGLLLVPNGKLLGIAFGDQWEEKTIISTTQISINSTSTQSGLNDDAFSDGDEDFPSSTSEGVGEHSWGVFFTIIGTVLLDFDSDACQSPSRAYLLDITVPEDHTRGLSTFTIMAGLGGSLGYAMGAINWDSNFIGHFFGGHVRAVFTIITFLFIGCVLCTLYSFCEVPMGEVEAMSRKDSKTGLRNTKEITENYGSIGTEQEQIPLDILKNTNAAHSEGQPENSESNLQQNNSGNPEDGRGIKALEEGPKTEDPQVTLRQYLLSIIYMPKSLRLLCVTNLFCWMSLVCYSLYFTDFVGEAVFGGDPMSPDESPSRQKFEEGVRFGCWGMCLYSLSCSIYSFIIEKLVKNFGARPVYIYGQLIYTFGMVMMAALRHKAAVIIFSCCAGVMYSTLFTMPYLLVAHYHSLGTFHQLTEEEQEQGNAENEEQIRGIGTDVAIVSSMVFLAQFILSLCMGTFITVIGSTTAVVIAAAILSFCGAISASQVIYLNL